METRQPRLWAALIITHIVATVAIFLRFLARRLTKIDLWLDDYFAGAAYVVQCSWVGFVAWWISNGLGLHIEVVPTQAAAALSQSLLNVWVADLLYATTLTLAPLSVLCFYWRMFKTSNIRIPIQVMWGLVVAWWILRIFMTVFSCVPVQAYWDLSIKPEDRVCMIDSGHFFFWTVLAHLLLDCIILALPLWEIRKLQLPLNQRVGLSAIFMSGLFICAASIMQLVTSNAYDPNSLDVPWNISNVMIWATVEMNFATASCCAPLLRPIWAVYVRGRPLTGVDRSLPKSNGYGRTCAQDTKPLTLVHLQSVDADESGSTHQLTGSLREGCSLREEGREGRENQWMGNDGLSGLQTIIGGRHYHDAENQRGILVTREIGISSGRATPSGS